MAFLSCVVCCILTGKLLIPAAGEDLAESAFSDLLTSDNLQLKVYTSTVLSL